MNRYISYLLLSLILLLAGCPDGGRWARYSGGGSFNGTSPDGKQIVFDTWAQKIWTMSVDGTNKTQIGTGASASYSPNGKQIVYVSGEFAREISVMNADGTNTKPIISANNYMSHPTFLNDNKTIIFLDQPNASGTGLIQQFDTVKNARTQLLDSRVPVVTNTGQQTPNGG